MIEIKDKQILIDGKPQLILCGEIHYFRLDPKDWQDRIDKLKQAGCNAVASYVPWIMHEPIQGEFDLDGHTHPELDLGGFIDLCKKNDLYFFVRPGPFIMAEMKNEGLPYWVYEWYPEIIPTGWDNAPATTKTVDYLAPGFLLAARNWYAAVMPVIAERLYQNGGNIIGVQLDNEVGMLSWVSNCPDFTAPLLADFAFWLTDTYVQEELKARYPFDLGNEAIFREKIVSPEEGYAGELLHDLGYFMRNRFARYIAVLRSYAEEFGVRDVPFVVNIHGTGGGRGWTFPIGISQLYESYTQAPGYLYGSDIYFGNLTMDNFQDLYLINSFMDAVSRADQPLTSLEFECGDGNYGSTFGGRYDPSAADFKTRMCVAQGNRMLNYYLFAGGVNPRLDELPGDGNDRVAFTGECHGFAAPISPEGELNYTYPRMARVIHAMAAVADKLGIMKEQRDPVAFAFIPDYFMTEHVYQKSSRMTEIARNMERHRAGGSWEVMARAMLLAGYRFGAVDVQNRPLEPMATPVLVLASARYMQSDVQERIAGYLNQGGRLLLYGEVPLYDLEGKPCEILADALRVQPVDIRKSKDFYYLSVYADGFAAPRPEIRTDVAQVFRSTHVEPILRVYGTDEVCGFEVVTGKGRAVVIATSYDCDIALFQSALKRLGAKPGLVHDCKEHGIFMTSTSTAEGERFLHMLNLDGFEKQAHIYEQGQPLFEGRTLTLESKAGIMLPLQIWLDDVCILYSTAEIARVGTHAIDFRLTQREDVIALKTARVILPSSDYTVTEDEKGGVKRIVSLKDAKIDDRLTVIFKETDGV